LHERKPIPLAFSTSSSKIIFMDKNTKKIFVVDDDEMLSMAL